MKRLIALLLALCAGTAHATVLAYVENTQGGLIEFTDVACQISGRVAAIVDAGGSVLQYGCWIWEDPNIDVTWATGDTRFYNAANVTLTEAARKLVKPKPSM
jgi:hypothetical protein